MFGALAGCSGELSVLSPASAGAADAAALWWGMAIGFTAVFIAVVALWVYAIRRPPTPLKPSAARRQYQYWLISGGLVLPSIAILLLLLFGIPAGHRMQLPAGHDDEPLQIEVTARQWQWEVSYPDSGIELVNEIHLPAGKVAEIHLTSQDVIHSFWVPRLGGKLDVLPGRANVLRLKPDQAGTYRGQCAEFCGTGHTYMQFTVVVHETGAFEHWQERELSDD
ncbi:MAG TPA: cytochrome c oxidase subunit II [Marinobacter sp.]|nr:cytochrome c oxidase subunit II [Marinobacter sp.]